MSNSPGRVCPASCAGGLMLSVRRYVHNPDKILGPLISAGQRVMDLGCGPGYFAIPMARMVGPVGKVVAIDIQNAMLDLLRANAAKACVLERMEPHLSSTDAIGAVDPVDFALAFYMMHEVPNQAALLAEVRSLLKPGGRLLLVEPWGHVSGAAFARSVESALTAGFRKVDAPKVALSRAVLLARA